MNGSTTAPRGFSGRFGWSGYALGFALGGFFDGILLHQVLQWHHLLSGVEQARLDIRVLILWDGIFHLIMYIIAAIGLSLLWRARQEFAAVGADRDLFANVLIGFGAWHIIDSVLSHWILGIHRVRMDVSHPLFWDLLWFTAFGIIPVVIGVLMKRARPSDRSRSNRSPLILALGVLVTAPLAALPPAGQSQVVVLFRPGISEQHAIAAIGAVGGRLLGTDSSGQLWAIDLAPGGNVAELYLHGALLVSNSMLPLGCFKWMRG